MNRPTPTQATIRHAVQTLMRDLWDDLPGDPGRCDAALVDFISNGILLCGDATGHKLLRRVRHYVRGFYRTAFELPTHTTPDRIDIELTLTQGLLRALGYYREPTPTTALLAGHYHALSGALLSDVHDRGRPDRLYRPGNILIRPYTQFCYN